MGSVKLVTSCYDVRNIQSAALVVAMLSLARGCFHKVSFTSDEKDIKNIDNTRLCEFLYTILPFFSEPRTYSYSWLIFFLAAIYSIFEYIFHCWLCYCWASSVHPKVEHISYFYLIYFTENSFIQSLIDIYISELIWTLFFYFSMGFIIISAYCCHQVFLRLHISTNRQAAVTTFVIAMLSTRCVIRNQVWQSKETLFRYDKIIKKTQKVSCNSYN